jgi:putative transposase
MLSESRWVPGFAVRSTNTEMSGIWIIRRVVSSKVTLANIDTRQVIVKEIQDLEEYLNNNTLIFLADDRCNGEITFKDLPEAYQEESARKYAYVSAYFESGEKKRSKKKLERIIREVADVIEDDKLPAWSTVNNWIKQYSNAGFSIKGLYPNHLKKGSRARRMDSRVYDIIGSLMRLYFKESQMLPSTIHRMVEAKILRHNLDNPDDLIKIPAYSTVKYHLDQQSYQAHTLGRIGKKRARYEFSTVGTAPKTSRILERVEADHTPLDINVLHDETNTLLGRPTLTILIDHYSRMIAGFQISFEEPSYASAAMAIGSAILPKCELLEFYGIEGDWPAQGVMELMVADNGAEFWSENLDLAISEIGSVLQYAPVKSPNYKGVVERFFRTLKTSFIDSLPGKTNGVGNGSDEYSAAKEAKLTLTEFKKLFLNWLVNIYHLEPVGDMEFSPLDLWNSSAREFPIVEEDVKKIETALMCSDTRTLHRDGIQFEKLHYNSDAIRDIYRREGRTELRIKYSPFNIGYIYVLDEINRVYIRVDCLEYQYAKGLSLYAHRAIRKRINERGKSYQDNAVLQRAKAELFGEIEELHQRNVRRKTQVTTKKSARVHSLGVADLAAEASDEARASAYTADAQIEVTTDDWEVW